MRQLTPRTVTCNTLTVVITSGTGSRNTPCSTLAISKEELRTGGRRLWCVDSPDVAVLVASGVWACPRQSWRRVLMEGVVYVTVLPMLVTSAVAGVAQGYA